MAVCQFCDTDFVGTDGDGGGRFRNADELVVQLETLAGATRFVVCTGGEPLLQLDPPLIDALHARDFEIAIETNGTLPVPAGIDWVCVSPKANAELVVTRGDELKLVYRQQGGEPERYADLDFSHFFLQPMDGPDRDRFTAESIAYCRAHPQWRLSIQTHKDLGIPRTSSRSSPSRPPTGCQMCRPTTSAPGCTVTRSGSRSASSARSVPTPDGCST